MSRALAFIGSPGPLDYGARLARLRWRRAAGAGTELDWAASSPVAQALGLAPGATSWVLVRDAPALPVGSVPEPAAGAILAARAARPPAVHTLRELEACALAPAASAAPSPAFAFRAEDSAPREGENVTAFVERLESRARRTPAFFAVVFADPSEAGRPELTRRLPRGRLRILDAGCGAGGGIGLARDPDWEIVGIEKDPRLAERARQRGHRVLEGDLPRLLSELEAKGGRFDALVFADVLEHLEDPHDALSRARRLAADGAVLLVSVPNAGHLSFVRDLLLGRHDPVPAGVCDAGHLRWFTRDSLADALGETGWRLESLEGEPGLAVPDPAPFRELAAAWPGADFAGLSTYQWIATARPA